MGAFFHAVLYQPLYNALVFLLGLVPGHEVGIAVIVLTVLVRIIIFPLAQNGIKTNIALKKLQPQIEALKKKHQNDTDAKARETMALYKENDIHMSAPFLLILVQLPLIIGLYWVFRYGNLPAIDMTQLYAFVHAPAAISMQFLGLIDMSTRSVILALTTGITQFVFAKLSMQPPAADGSGFSHDLARSMHLQMRYVLPFVMCFIAYSLAAAVALYWTTSNLFNIAQELFVRRRLEREAANAN
ncbi:MAG TPA: YidC/Oxa1 family membrane protein insertase [Candidatus Paceibacterota bacterium]|nr:YidC/Oxa1 family membrane protein insertase [Candidatus Paceibacterota bacterium]